MIVKICKFPKIMVPLPHHKLIKPYWLINLNLQTKKTMKLKKYLNFIKFCITINIKKKLILRTIENKD